MSGIISLKGNRYGLSVNISENASFEEVKNEIAEYFQHAQKMFGNEKIAIGFEGKILTDSERDELVSIIRSSCELQIVCVMDFNTETEEIFKQAVNKEAGNEEASEEQAETLDGENVEAQDFDITSICKFYKGNVRSGMVINEESSLVILGDVNAGGEIYSGGNIIILGALRGTVYAGTSGKKDAFVFALNMEPIQIQIDDVIGRAVDGNKIGNSKTNEEHEPKIAMVKDNAIAIQLVSRTVLNDINL